jgi:light-regulated signal transduction histidine kinase (bacteriophytochrome)
MAKKTNYDSDFCGSLPLHHINVVQSYGYLAVLDKADLKLLQVSENAEELFGRSLKTLIGTSLSDYADTAQLTSLGQRFKDNLKEKFPVSLMLNGRRAMTLAHFKPDYIILEIEKAEPERERSFTSVFEEVKYAMAAIEAADTIESASQAAVHELRRLTGFDGVMMYRFDEEWNGTVIAEEKEAPELEHYLGHTFPGSDVPKQARDLYLKNPYRLIPDRDFTPVRLHPVMNPLTSSFIDLSDCNLRGVAAVHLEYLKNMNVQASMSIRVIDNGKLWGLIACHHVTPHYLNFELCSVCELISSVISNRISAIVHQSAFQTDSDLQRYLTELAAQVYAKDDLLAGLLDPAHTHLRQLLKAGGVAVQLGNVLHTEGEVPDRDMLDNLRLWLQNKNEGKVYHTDSLPEQFDEARACAKLASGLLAIPLNAEQGDFILAFRPEVVETINWGGDPNKTINFEPDGKKYHPRASFKLWQETVHHTSEPWTAGEVAAAESLRTFIFEFTTKKNQA